MSNLSDPVQLELVLSSLGANDTSIIRKGEKQLKPFLKRPDCIPALLFQIKNSTNVNVRHVASILLKKRGNVLYSKCNQAQKTEIKAMIVNLLITETIKPVRTAIAGAVASLCKSAMNNGESWPEIFDILTQLARDQSDENRNLCYNLLSQLSESVPANLKPHTAILAQMFVAGCQDASSSVSTAAMSATAACVAALADEPEVMQFQIVIAPMLQVMQQCMVRGDEIVVTEGLDVIQDCVAMDQPLINDRIQDIVQFIFTILQTPGLEDSLVQSAGQTLLSIIECRPKLVAKQQLVSPILNALVKMIADAKTSAAGALYSFGDDSNINSNEDDEDDDEDYNPEMRQQELAQSCLDSMALNIPPKYFVEPVLAICSQCIASPESHMRKAGCAVLGVIAEGCCDAIRPRIADILPPLIQSMKDEDYFVRECACFALGQFSEHCQPDILYHHQTILPAVFIALDDPRPTVQGTSCYVIENFCEGLQPETLRPFLLPLVQKLGQLLQCSEQKTTKEMALAALAATAVAAEIDFLPYTEATCQFLLPYLFITEPAMYSLRGRALECLGHIAVAIGKDNFLPYFETGMKSANQGIELEDDGLKEYSYIFVANCAKVLGNYFDVHLPTLVPHLLEIICENEMTPVNEDDEDEEDEEVDGKDKHGEVDLGADDEGDDDEELGDMHLNILEGFVHSKKSALTALGALAQYTGVAFFPHLAASLNAILTEPNGCLYSFHKVIRSEGITTLPQLLSVACAKHGPTTTPTKGEAIVLDPFVAEVTRVSLLAFIILIEDDSERTVVANALEGVGGLLEHVGMVALYGVDEEKKSLSDRLMAGMLLLLQEKGKCQTVLARDTQEDDDDSGHDNLVMDSLVDLIGIMAKTIGPEFIKFFDHLKKPLVRYTKISRPYSDRAMAIGCFAEVIDEIGPAAVSYVDFILPLIQLGLSDEMESVRRNAAFCLNAVCGSVGSLIAQHFPQMLQWLQPLCTRPASQTSSDTGGADIDNAISAVARMIKVAPQQVPLPIVLPAMLAALPLRADMIETPNVYGALIFLLQSGESTALSMLPQLLIAFAVAIQDGSKVLDQAKAEIISCLKFMSTDNRFQGLLASAFQQMSDAQLKYVLERALQF